MDDWVERGQEWPPISCGRPSLKIAFHITGNLLRTPSVGVSGQEYLVLLESQLMGFEMYTGGERKLERSCAGTFLQSGIWENW